MTPRDLPELAFVRTIGTDMLRKLLCRTPKTCTWCGEPVKGGRRTWCSQACVDLFKECWAPSWIRSRIFRREHGVCRLCGHDTQYWVKWRKRLKQGYGYREDQLCGHHDAAWPNPERINRRSRKNRRRFQRYRAAWHRTLRHLMRWEADHIVPVVRGGAMLGLSNIRTLCKRCHDAETARLAGERAAERRPEYRQLALLK